MGTSLWYWLVCLPCNSDGANEVDRVNEGIVFWLKWSMVLYCYIL